MKGSFFFSHRLEPTLRLEASLLFNNNLHCSSAMISALLLVPGLSQQALALQQNMGSGPLTLLSAVPSWLTSVTSLSLRRHGAENVMIREHVDQLGFAVRWKSGGC